MSFVCADMDCCKHTLAYTTEIQKNNTKLFILIVETTICTCVGNWN